MTNFDHIQIEYDLIFDTPFHCGTGLREGLIDRTVVRDNERYLYIPGSTIKGVLRERCEQIARMYEELKPKLIGSPHVEAMALHDLGTTHTMITRVFGSQAYPGSLFFDDARQDEATKQLYGSHTKDGQRHYAELQVDLYTQVRLDRLTRTAVPSALYTSEFGMRNMIFKGSITGVLECIHISSDIHKAFDDETTAPSYSLLLLLAGLHMLDSIGGNKSSGKGRCHCHIKMLRVNHNIYHNEKDADVEPIWNRWLQHLEVLSYYSLVQEDM